MENQQQNYHHAVPCLYLSAMSNNLKEYSVILTTSFYDINQKILTKKGYFQSFS